MRIKEAEKKVRAGEASPILFFMELKLMDLNVLAGYSGFWTWQIKRHMKPAVFQKLSTKQLNKYAAAFEITIDELIHFKKGE